MFAIFELCFFFFVSIANLCPTLSCWLFRDADAFLQLLVMLTPNEIRDVVLDVSQMSMWGVFWRSSHLGPSWEWLLTSSTAVVRGRCRPPSSSSSFGFSWSWSVTVSVVSSPSWDLLTSPVLALLGSQSLLFPGFFSLHAWAFWEVKNNPLWMLNRFP